jgi:cyclohexa-1,5-dienecarbonyl-CoA hydratase
MKVEVIRRDHAIELKLNDPPGNVLDRESALQIADLIRFHGSDPKLKLLLFSAEGKHFSYGASVPEHDLGLVGGFLPAFHDIFAAMLETEVPTAAAVRGLCLGGAFELAAACNFLLAERSAVFAVPEIQLGVFPPVACALFPWKYGGSVSEDLILSGRRVKSEEAVRHGIISRLATDRSLEEEVDAFIDEDIAPRSASSLRHACSATRGALLSEFLPRLKELERAYLDELMATHDAQEGIAAFNERRDPRWTHA